MAATSERTGEPLRGRHAVVTGGGTGIGAAIAAAFSAAGANVTVMGRRPAPLQRQAELLRNTQAIVCDLSQPDQVAIAFAAATADVGPVDIMVNNAGQVETAPFHQLDPGRWQALLDVNLNGAFTCMRLVYPGRRERGWGRIVTVASTAALKGYAYTSAYCAAKHAVLGLTRAVALEAAASGVTVNAVCPGYTDTDIVGAAVRKLSVKTGRSAEQVLATFTAGNPQGRLVRPAEVANAVLWLCAPGSEAITGQAIAVAGGEVM